MTVDIGNAVLIIGCAVVALGLIALASHFKNTAFAYGSLGFWFITGAISYSLSVSGWDIYYIIFWAAMVMAFVSGFMVFSIYSGGVKERSIDASREADEFEANHPGFSGLDSDLQDVILAQDSLNKFRKKNKLAKYN